MSNYPVPKSWIGDIDERTPVSHKLELRDHTWVYNPMTDGFICQCRAFISERMIKEYGEPGAPNDMRLNVIWAIYGHQSWEEPDKLCPLI